MTWRTLADDGPLSLNRCNFPEIEYEYVPLEKGARGFIAPEGNLRWGPLRINRKQEIEQAVCEWCPFYFHGLITTPN